MKTHSLAPMLSAPRVLLLLFSIVVWTAMLAAIVVMELDERTLRGVSVWAKPVKFMASVGLLSATTAWLIGLLQPERRTSTPGAQRPRFFFRSGRSSWRTSHCKLAWARRRTTTRPTSCTPRYMV